MQTTPAAPTGWSRNTASVRRSAASSGARSAGPASTASDAAVRTGYKLMCKHFHAACLLVDGLSSQLTVPDPQRPDSPPEVVDEPPPPPPSRPAEQCALAELAAVPEGAGTLFAAALVKIGELNQLVAAVPRADGVPSKQLGDTLNRPWNARIVPQPCIQSRWAKRPRVAPGASGQRRGERARHESQPWRHEFLRCHKQRILRAQR